MQVLVCTWPAVGSMMRFDVEEEGEGPDILLIKELASSFSSCEGGSLIGCDIS